MKWIGQNIYDQVSRFRNDVFFETNTVTFTSASADNPAVIIENTTADNQAARLQFKKHRGVDAVDGDNVGEVEFWGYDDGTPSEQLYGKITVEVHDATTDEESGAMYLNVANHDGGSNAGLKLTGGSTGDEVDAEIGRGTASVTTVVGTLTMGSTAAIDNSGAWVGGVIPSAKLDTDTAHLSGVQTFTGTKSFGTITSFLGTLGSKILVDGDSSANPGDGAAIHVDAFDVTDINTSASGTAARYAHVSIENPRLKATNSSVTTTDAATLYIKGAPVASTNQTITKAWALWVDAGNARFDGDIDLEGDMDINGTLETDALTIGGATIAAIGTTAITTLGTIGTGVWEGDDIPVANGGTGASNLDAFCLLAGNQTLTGTKTLNSFKGTGGATVTNILDEDAMGSDSATALATQQSIKAYADTKVSSAAQRQLTFHNYKADQDTTKTYVSLADADSESTNTANNDMPLTAPVAGKLLKVFLRSNKNLGSHTLTWRLETQAGVNYTAGPSVVGTQSGAGCQNTTMTTYDFTSSLDSGDNLVDAGDAVYLSLQSDTDFGNNVIYYITCMWEWDLN